MGKNSRANYGTVECTIGGNEYTLKPTLRAVDKIITRWPGGMGEALAAVQDPLLAIRASAFVIASGAGLTGKDAEEIAEDVFAEGLGQVQETAVKYLMLLINPTGKEAEDTEPGE